MFCLLTAFVAATTETSAVDDPKCRKVSLKEFAAMVGNKTFLLVELPAGRRAVECRWVFSMNFGFDGPFERLDWLLKSSVRLEELTMVKHLFKSSETEVSLSYLQLLVQNLSSVIQ